VKLAIIVTYIPAYLESVKLLQIKLFKKNWVFAKSDKMAIKIYKTKGVEKLLKKRTTMMNSLMPCIILLLLCTLSTSDQFCLRVAVRK